jgi:hypothetical protein
MKKLLIFGLSLISVIIFLCGCTGDSGGVDGSTAQVMADEFVRPYLNYPSSGDFDIWDTSSSSCGENCWIVYGSGTAQNAFGARIGFTYKIKMEYIGDDPYSESSWDTYLYYINEE